MSKLVVGQEITVTKNDKKRKGKVICIHRKHRWFAVEFRSNYWNPFKKAFDRYKECFYLHPERQQE